MTTYDNDRYISKCPICKNPLETEDIDYDFDGKQNEIAYCNKCNLSFEFYIRYHRLWKYITFDEKGNTTNTTYVYKGGK